MQTQFSAARQQNLQVAEANSILRSCVRCGMCTAHCPTYQLLGNEADSPRGRIYLIKQMLEENGTPSHDTVLHLDRCLSCLACSSICPSEVDYRHLLDQARHYIEDHYSRPPLDRLFRNTLAWLMVRPVLFRWAMRAGRPFRRFHRLFPENSRPAAMLRMIPQSLPVQNMPAPGWYHPQAEPVARVGLFIGCVQTVLAPQFYARSISLLNRFGISVYIPKQSHCCGAIVQHMGKAAQAKDLAARTLSVFSGHEDWDGVIVNVSGCGSHLKDYGYFSAEAGAALAEKTYDISEFLVKYTAPEHSRIDLANPPRVAYHAACTLQHGQRITSAPKTLLQQAGFDVAEPSEAHICCGSAGTYNLLQPEISTQLVKRKVGHIQQLQPGFIAADNIGCLMQIAAHQDTPVVHTLELLDWAYGGAAPRGISSK